MSSEMGETRKLMGDLFEITEELQKRFPSAHFTIDGHLLSSIGKAVASEDYGLEILESGLSDHDARAADGRLVQIKSTQVNSVALKSEPHHLVVLAFGPSCQVEEVFNGPGGEVWRACGSPSKAGQKKIGLAKLRGMNRGVSDDERIPKIR